MKTIFKNIVFALTLGTAVTLNSCSSDFLDITPTDQYSEDAMFSDAALSQAFLNSIYAQLRNEGYQRNSCFGKRPAMV